MCPSATLPAAKAGAFEFRAWSWDEGGWGDVRDKDPELRDRGSYGENERNCNRTGENYWKETQKLKDSGVDLLVSILVTIFIAFNSLSICCSLVFNSWINYFRIIILKGEGKAPTFPNHKPTFLFLPLV